MRAVIMRPVDVLSSVIGWLQHPALTAHDVDARFRALITPTLRATFGERV